MWVIHSLSSADVVGKPMQVSISVSKISLNLRLLRRKKVNSKEKLLQNNVFSVKMLKHYSRFLKIYLKYVFFSCTVKCGESGLAGRVGTKFRPSKTETHLRSGDFLIFGSTPKKHRKLPLHHRKPARAVDSLFSRFETSSQIAPPVPTPPTSR